MREKKEEEEEEERREKKEEEDEGFLGIFPIGPPWGIGLANLTSLKSEIYRKKRRRVGCN